MDNATVSSLITAASGLIGSGLGVVATSRLTNYRLQRLEEEVKCIAKKTDDVTILNEQLKGVIEDVKELKKC